MKFLACISLYNPTINQIKNINSYKNCFDKILIYDNSSNNDSYVKYIDILMEIMMDFANVLTML